MVKINFKTVQNKLFSLEAEGSETVADLKKKIQESQTFPVENQKLIYSGKILNDTANVESLNIKEKDFLVVMVSKPKAAKPAPAPAAPAPAAAPTQEASTSTPAPAPAPSAPTPAAPSDTPATESAPAQSTGTGTGFGGGSFLSGPELQSAISSMTEMGFERDLVMRAMKASYNNPDRAVEYLMTGDIPNVEGMGRPAEGAAPAAQAAPSAPAAAAPASAAAAPTPAPSAGSASDNLFAAAEAAMNRDRGNPAAATGGGGGAGAGAGGGGLDTAMLEQLAQSPQMQQLRQMVQENPALIQPLMQQIATSNPQLAQLINQNPQALYDLLGAGAAGEGDDEDGYQGAQVMHVDLTEAEAAAVERLEALGFERQMVLQAYMLCDKNEELAANFLFDSGDDEMA